MTPAAATLGFKRAVVTAYARAGVLVLSFRPRLSGAGLRACTLFTQAKVSLVRLGTPYRGAVAGRMCGPHLPLLDLRAAGFAPSPAFFGGVSDV